MNLEIDDLDERFEQSRFANWSVDPWDMQVTMPEWFMEDLIPQHSIGMLYGESNSGKSHLACDLAIATAQGETTWCEQAIQPGCVVMFSESIGHTRARMRAYADKNEFAEMKHPLYVLPAPQLERDEIELFTMWMMNLPERPVLLIFDTFSTSFSFAGGESENDNSAVAKLLNSLEKVAGFMHPKGTIMIVHHTSKASGGHSARGASALIGNIDYSIRVEWDEATEKTMAYWEKDRWRLCAEAPIFAGTMRKTHTTFTNGIRPMSILDWEYQSRARMEAEKQEAEEMEFDSIKANFRNRVNDAIKNCGFAFFRTNSNARVTDELHAGYVQLNDFCPKYYQKEMKEWVLDRFTDHRRESVFTKTGKEIGLKFM